VLNEPFDPGRLLQALGKARAEVVMIGGLALVSRGIIRPTTDLDVCYRVSRESSEILISALSPLHPRLRLAPSPEASLLVAAFRFNARTLRQGSNLTLMTDAGPLDLLAHVPGLGGYDEVLVAATSLEMYGVTIAVLDIEGLAQAKRAAGRAKDLAVLPELEALLHMRTRQDAPNAATGEDAEET
jgi:hypothetical protein